MSRPRRLEETLLGDHRHALVGEWLARQAPGPVVLLCREAPAEVAGGRLGVRLESCLAATPAHRLVDLVLAGAQPLVILREGCHLPDPPVLTTLVRLLGPSRISVTGNGGHVESAAGPLVECAHPPVSRRGLLGMSAGSPARPRHKSADDVGRLVESLRRVGTINSRAQSPARALTVSDCTACGLCTRVCANHAFELLHTERTSTLTHFPDRCRGDRTCVETCPVAAIADPNALLWTDVLAGGPRTLATLTTGKCVRCGARTTAGELCEPCAFRRAHPFGWAPPPLPPH